jgi:Protein of unknown function (DUF4058)
LHAGAGLLKYGSSETGAAMPFSSIQDANRFGSSPSLKMQSPRCLKTAASGGVSRNNLPNPRGTCYNSRYEAPLPRHGPVSGAARGGCPLSLMHLRCDQIQEQLSDDLTARLGERLVVESPLDVPRSIYLDVRVVDHGYFSGTGAATVLDEPIAEPIVIRPNEESTQPFIEIIEPDSAKLITVIEFISPTNKWPGDGRDKYLRKQSEVRNAGVNLVEVDLIRVGPRVFLLPSSQFPQDMNTHYGACVFRAWGNPQFELYPMSLREPLRPVRVPLRKDDTDIVLRLQPLIEMAYRNGRYHRTDYQKPCIPPLDGEDAVWVKQLIAPK